MGWREETLAVLVKEGDTLGSRGEAVDGSVGRSGGLVVDVSAGALFWWATNSLRHRNRDT